MARLEGILAEMEALIKEARGLIISNTEMTEEWILKEKASLEEDKVFRETEKL